MSEHKIHGHDMWVGYKYTRNVIFWLIKKPKSEARFINITKSKITYQKREMFITVL